MNSKIFTAQVVKVFNSHIIIELSDGSTKLVHISEVSDYFITHFKTMFEIGSVYEFESRGEGSEEIVSWKSLNSRFMKNPFEFKLKETNEGFKNLYNSVMEEVKND